MTDITTRIYLQDDLKGEKLMTIGRDNGTCSKAGHDFGKIGTWEACQAKTGLSEPCSTA